MINGLDGNRLLKTFALLIEDKMVAGIFGWHSAFNNLSKVAT